MCAAIHIPHYKLIRKNPPLLKGYYTQPLIQDFVQKCLSQRKGNLFCIIKLNRVNITSSLIYVAYIEMFTSTQTYTHICVNSIVYLCVLFASIYLTVTYVSSLLSVCVQFASLSVCLSNIYFFFYLSCLLIYLSSTYLSVCLTTCYPSIYLPTSVCLIIWLFAYLCFYLSINPTYKPAYLSIYPSTYPSIYTIKLSSNHI